jgi:hypothetical protein
MLPDLSKSETLELPQGQPSFAVGVMADSNNPQSFCALTAGVQPAGHYGRKIKVNAVLGGEDFGGRLLGV